MKKYSKIVCCFFLVCILSTSACSDSFLDRAPTAELDLEQVFSDYELAKKYQLRLYATLRGGFSAFKNGDSDLGWGYDLVSNLDDHSMASKSDASTLEMISGNWNRAEGSNWGSAFEVARKWRFSYQSIRAINIFLENYSKVPLQTEEQTKEMEALVGEAYCLRAHHYYELIKRWGGVPIINHVMSPTEDQRPYRKNITECIQSIVSDCDEAALRMPVKIANSQWLGRVTKGTALGIKAKALLWGASPYWSQRGSGITYKEAADAALAVINLKNEDGTSAYELMNDYRDVFMVNFNKEALYFENTTTKQSWDYYTVLPVLMGGFANGMLASQEFVNCYEIKNSNGDYVSFDMNNPDHVANMYNKERRDPRFDKTVFYNGCRWQGETLGFYEGGNCGRPEGDKNYYLGYCFKKYFNEDVRNVTMGGIPRGGTFIFNWIFLRYADILLMYAEAQNQVAGPNSIGGDGVNGITALEALNQVRHRAGIGELTAVSQSELDEKVRNERSVELVIEDQRIFDLRRWDIADKVLSKPLHGAYAKKVGNNYEYDFTWVNGPVRKIWENRDQFFLYPINIEEIQRNPNLAQNPGWLDIIRK